VIIRQTTAYDAIVYNEKAHNISRAQAVESTHYCIFHQKLFAEKCTRYEAQANVQQADAEECNLTVHAK